MNGRAWGRLVEGVRVAAVPLLAITFAVASITVPEHGGHVITSVTELSPALTIADVTAGLAMIAAGSIAWLLGRRPLGLAAVLAGASWFGSDWAASVVAPGPVRAIGVLATAMTLPIVVGVLAIGLRDGPDGSRYRIPLLAGAAVALLATFWLVAWVPSLDPRCLAVCDTNPLGLGMDYGLARTLANAWQGLTVIVGVLLVAWAAGRVRRSSDWVRRRDRGLLVPAIGVGLAWTLWGISLVLPSTAAPPAGNLAVLAFACRAAALTLLAGGLILRIAEEQRTLASVRRISERLSPLPGGGTLRAALAAALGDPDLRLAYALPQGGSLVDEEGRPVDRGSSEPWSEQTAEIRTGLETVAVAFHSSGAARSSVAALGPAVRLAADNERLLASIRHEMLQLRESRARIVQAGDTARHRMERNLHDGAQQRMLGVLYELSMARAAAGAGDRDALRPIDDSVRITGETIDALRRLARGLHQSVLTESGLAAAIEALADEAPILVALDTSQDLRWCPSVEAAAWRVLVRLIAAAHQAAAREVLVRTRDQDGHLALTIVIAGLREALDTVSLADDVGAAGGDLESSWSDDGSMTVRVELPCE